MSWQQLDRIAPEPELAAALGLAHLGLGTQHLHEQGEGKVGQCQVEALWVIGLLPEYGTGLPKTALLYARATRVHHRREQQPDWRRLALVWRPVVGPRALRRIGPLDVEEDPLRPALSRMDLRGAEEGPAATGEDDLMITSLSPTLSLDLLASARSEVMRPLLPTVRSLLDRLASGEAEVSALKQRWF